MNQNSNLADALSQVAPFVVVNMPCQNCKATFQLTVTLPLPEKPPPCTCCGEPKAGLAWDCPHCQRHQWTSHDAIAALVTAATH
jgi:hypothetical protein